MTTHFNPAHRAKLDSPERRLILPPETILHEFGLSSGEIMVDVGAGVGYFALPAAEIVGPTGRVIAVDVSSEMVEELERRRAAAAVTNLEILRSEEYTFGIGSGVADLVLVATVLHEVDDKRRLLEEARRVLKAAGRIGIVEWRAAEMPMGPRLSVRLEPSVTSRFLEEAGFSSIRTRDLNEAIYLASAVA